MKEDIFMSIKPKCPLKISLCIETIFEVNDVIIKSVLYIMIYYVFSVRSLSSGLAAVSDYLHTHRWTDVRKWWFIENVLCLVPHLHWMNPRSLSSRSRIALRKTSTSHFL